MDRKTKKAARALSKRVLREIRHGKHDVERDVRIVVRKSALAGAGSALTLLGLLGMFGAGVTRTASRAKRGTLILLSGTASAIGFASVRKALRRMDLSPRKATARIKDAVSTAAKAFS
jgi:hypothetical protein